MTTNQRSQMLDRYAIADRWLRRIYDTQGRSEAHRICIYHFLMKTCEPRLRKIIQDTYNYDEYLSSLHGAN